MTYRKYYWNHFKQQIHVAFIMLWHGVIRNEGHHSGWSKGWFYGKKKL